MEEWLGLKPGVIVAAFAGGISAALIMRDVTPLRAVSAVVVGCFTGAFLAPLVTHYFVVHGIAEAGGAATNAAAYVVGVSGMAVCNGLIEAASRILQKQVPPSPPSKGERP